MKDELTEQQTKAILKALDDAIDSGPWGESNFLRVIGNNLREIRENFISQLGDKELEKLTELHAATQIARQDGQQEIFITLYSSEGSNIQAWERILANLPHQMISRPIYANEEDAKYITKSKENKINEAYVAIYIKQSDILKVGQDKLLFDKFNKPLMNLKDKSLSLDNVTRFVHMSDVYYYIKGRLVKNTQID